MKQSNGESLQAHSPCHPGPVLTCPGWWWWSPRPRSISLSPPGGDLLGASSSLLGVQDKYLHSTVAVEILKTPVGPGPSRLGVFPDGVHEWRDHNWAMGEFNYGFVLGPHLKDLHPSAEARVEESSRECSNIGQHEHHTRNGFTMS